VALGPGALDKLPKGIRKDPQAVAETVINNMRKVIIDERAMNPKYYDRMSELLDAFRTRTARSDQLQAVP
jgi:type I restriction enzyme R subunit